MIRILPRTLAWRLLSGCAVGLCVAASPVWAATDTTTTTVGTTTGTTSTSKTLHHTHKATHSASVTKTGHGKMVTKQTVMSKTATKTMVASHHGKTSSAATGIATPNTHGARHGTTLHGTHPKIALKPVVVAKPAPVPVAPTKPTPPPPDPNKGSATGLPVPRFAALRSDQVNLRAGPGTRYPIDWVYQRRDLPVRIEREFEVWRLVSMPDGEKGWVHLATLTGRRGFVITGDQPQTLAGSASDAAPPVATLKPGVVGQLVSCITASDWCSVQVKGYRGYLKRSAFWGALPGEAVGP